MHMVVNCGLHSNLTPHARRPLVAVALPTTGAPSTGSRVIDQKLESNLLTCQILSALH